MDECDMDMGEITPTKQPPVLVPETPSPVFSRIVHKKDLINSPSKRKYWFEDVQGKVGAEVQQNGRLKIAEYDNKKTAFERLKKIRQKKSLFNHKTDSPKSYNLARPRDMWPSDSESDSDSSSGQSLSALLNTNRDGKIKPCSSIDRPARSVIDPMTSSASTPPDSPSLVPPLRKRIRLGLTDKVFGSCGLLTPPGKDSKSSDLCSSSSHSNKHRNSKSKQYKSSTSEFVSARDVLNSVAHSRPETVTSVDSASSNACSLETQLKSKTVDSKQEKRKRKKDYGPKNILDRLKSINGGSNFETPPFRVANVQSDFTSSVNLSALPAHNFYKKSPVKKHPVLNHHSGESAASSSGSERQSRGSPNHKLKRPAPTQYINAPEIVDIGSDDDAVVVVNQMESDESMARRLQEEMDHQFALAIAESHTPYHSEAPVGAPPHRGLRSRGPVSPGFGMPLFHDIDPDEATHIPDFPFMSVGGWAQNQLALFTSHVALLGSSGSWTSPARSRRPMGGRGSRGRTGRRNAVFQLNSPGGNGEDYDALLDLAESIGDARPKGLTKNQINYLPVKKFVPSSGESSQNKECLVCMCDFEKNENVRILTCFHDFHSKCIDKWLKGNNTCPICRVEVKLS